MFGLPAGGKRCSKCRRWWPATAEFFSRNVSKKDGFAYDCKVCSKSRHNAWRTANRIEINRRNRESHAANPELFRGYSKTYREKNTAKENARRKRWREGHREHVRQYNKENHAQYYETHKEQIAAYKRARHKADPGAAYRRVKAWRGSNPEKYRASLKSWRERNPEKNRLHQKRYRDSHRAQQSAARHRRRARLKSAEGIWAAADIEKLYTLQKGRCWWCKKKLGKKYHIDHRIPLSKGGTNWPSNLVLTCPKCNLSKNARLPEDFNGRLL